MNEYGPSERADKNNPDYKLARNITITGATAGALGVVVCVYGIKYDHSASASSQENLLPVECAAMESLIETVNDPEAGPFDIQSEAMATSVVYSMRADEENAIDNGYSSQDTYDAISRAGEFADMLTELGDITEQERQPAARPYLLDLTDIIERDCA